MSHFQILDGNGGPLRNTNKSTYKEFWVRCYDKEDLSKKLPDDGKSVVPDDLGTGK